MDTITVVVKGKKYDGLTATVQVAAGDDAIVLARPQLVAACPELAGRNWTLKKMVPTGPNAYTMTVSPAGHGAW